MDSTNGRIDVKRQVALYRTFDEARQHELEKIAETFELMRDRVETLEADLADEKETRQNWRRRAQDAESSLRRSQFILVLVDGDGYIFKDSYLRDAGDSGGARAAHDLNTEIQDYLRERNIIDPSGPDLQVMVNVYANRAGLAKHLYDAEMIQMPSQLDLFFHSFTNSKPLFHFIDCGYGKERADAKLRDTFRFYAYDVHCKHIFLACCHDNGYVAELDKYRHDVIAAPKTILVDSSQMGRDYRTLAFPTARLDVFNTQPIIINKKESIVPILPSMPRMPSIPPVNENISQTSGNAAPSTAPSTWSSVTASNATTPSTKVVKPVAAVAPTLPSPKSESIESNILFTKGIPVNRLNQRIDLKMNAPSPQELDAFDRRISDRKLCNKYHLGNDCWNNHCYFDHGKIDEKLKTTLRWKARTIPCGNGPECRDPYCFYGHQCPWGRGGCTNPKCPYAQKGMHDIVDLAVHRHVPADVY